MMNDTTDIWSLPWHALLGNLANGSRPEAFGDVAGSAVAGRTNAAHSGAVSASSWLVRARSRVAPRLPLRRPL
jgi:hypothetical protein